MAIPRAAAVPDLLRAGMTRAEVHTSLEAHTRVVRGIYVNTEGLSPEDHHLVRAQAGLRRISGTVLSHVSTAVAHGLPVPRRELTTVHLAPLDCRQGNPKHAAGLHIHSRTVAREQITHPRGLPSTTPLRCVIDCAALLDSDWGVVVADRAVALGLVRVADLRHAAAGTRRIHGAERVRQLPHLVSELAESPGESLTRMRLRRLRVEFAEQAVLLDVEGAPRVDFLVDGVLVVEFDGESKYAMNGNPAAAHWAEKRRHDRIVEAGYEAIRITWDELWDEPRLRARINRALLRARRRGLRAR